MLNTYLRYTNNPTTTATTMSRDRKTGTAMVAALLRELKEPGGVLVLCTPRIARIKIIITILS